MTHRQETTDQPIPRSTTSAEVTSTTDRTPRRGGLRSALTVVGTVAIAMLLLPLAANAAVTAFAAHDHGTLDIVVDGQTLDLVQPRYHDLHPQFHVHEGSGNLWHHHPSALTSILDFEPMTLEEAFDAMQMEATVDTFTLHGTTFDDADPDTSVTITVDGDPVDPAEVTITDGMDIVVAIETRT